jgi:thiol-disulfide isomerase/thioredoxin
MDVNDLDPDDPRIAYLEAREARRRHTLVGLIVACIAVLLAVIAIGWFTDSGGDPAVLVLPEGRLTTIEGDAFDLIELRGQPTVVNFFASWCAPCRDEMPDFEAVHQARAGAVHFVGINTGETNLDEAVALVDATGVTYTILLGADTSLIEELGGTNLPMTAFVDADGNVVETYIGVLGQDALDARIDTLLAR